MKTETPSGVFRQQRPTRADGRDRAPAADLSGAAERTGEARAAEPKDGSETVVRALRLPHLHGDWELASANAILAMHPDPLLLVQGQREVVRTNVAATKLLGGDLLHRDLASVLPDSKITEAVDCVLRGEARKVVDFTILARVDRHFRARIESLPDYAHHGRAALITITDFTEVKRAEKLRADFVANASHELRTPLAILLGFIETLNGSAADDPEAQRRFLPIMQQQAARMARLVDDLLALSRIELTEHAPPSTQIKIPRILRVVSEALSLRAAERGMSIEMRLAERLPMVMGDRDELSQVFQNLIDNAIKYATPNSPIVISAQASTKLPGGVAVSIQDRGDGIAERHLARLTERFYRVDTARSRSVGGTGLGLAIVKHVINRHRGLLEIESKIGEGSMFTVHLGGSATRTHDEARARANCPPAGSRPQEPDSLGKTTQLRLVGSQSTRHPDHA
jgi:two-component system phosphate regulon sensor histidine kinase PhoR